MEIINEDYVREEFKGVCCEDIYEHIFPSSESIEEAFNEIKKKIKEVFEFLFVLFSD